MAEAKQMTEERFLDHVYEGYQAGQRYCFILGAGASKTSGIRTGEELMREWRNFLIQRGKTYADNCAQDLDMEPSHYVHLLDPKASLRNDDYFTLFDLRYAGNPNAAYAFLEREMEHAFPSCGYYPLAMMLAHTENRLVITTNFDSLVEDALYIYTATHPLSVGHESLAPYMENDTRRPVIAKVHRDLLLQPMNREEEMQRLAKEWEEPLRNALQKYIPIVIGYAGGDHTLMSLLPRLKLKGLYWCYRDEVTERSIQKLVAQQDGYLVKIQGFDEIMFRLGERFAKEAEIKQVEEVKRLLRDQAENRGKRYAEQITAIQQKYEPQKNEDTPALSAGEDDDLRGIVRAIDTYAGQDGKQGGSAAGEPLAQDARIALLKGKYQQAYDLYTSAIALEPNAADYYDRRSTALYKMEQYEAALADESKAIALEPNNAEYYHGRAVILHAMERYEEALKDRIKAIELEPEKARYWQQRGVTLRAMGRYEEALKDSNRAVELEPENAKYYDSRSTGLHAMGRYEEALKDSNQAVELEPENAEYYNSRGVTLHAMGRYEEALKDSNQAVELEPENARYYNSRSVTLRAMGRYEEALADAEHAVELEPENARYWEQRGVTLYAMGRYKDALADINKAIDLDSKNAEYYGSRAGTLHSMEQYEEALEDRNKALELVPESARFWEQRGVTLHEMERYGDALKDKTKAVELAPENARYWDQRAVTLHAMEQLEEALKDRTKAIELEPKNARYWEQRSATLHAMGRYNEALTDSDKAVELAPDEPEYYRSRAITLRALGRAEDALADEEKARELEEKN